MDRQIACKLNIDQSKRLCSFQNDSRRTLAKQKFINLCSHYTETNGHINRHHVPTDLKTYRNDKRSFLNRIFVTLSEIRLIPVVYAAENNSTVDTNTVASDIVNANTDQFETSDDERDMAEHTRQERYLAKYQVSDEEVEEYIANETGWMRVYDMMFRREHDEPHYATTLIKSVTSLSMLCTGMLAGRSGGADAEEMFMEKNKALQYVNKYDAAKKLNYAKANGFIIYFFRYGLRAALLTFMFMGTTSIIRVYKNESNIMDNSIGGALSLALFRSYHGLEAACVGGIVGFLFGATLAVAESFSPVSHQQAHKDYIKRKLEVDKLYYRTGWDELDKKIASDDTWNNFK